MYISRQTFLFTPNRHQERSYVVAALERPGGPGWRWKNPLRQWSTRRILVDYDHGLDKAWQMLVDWASDIF